MKTTLKFTAAAAVVTVGTLMAGPVLASGVWHQTNTEVGLEYVVSHAQEGKTREQVRQELAEAKTQPGWVYQYYGLPKTPAWAPQGTTRTRADALAEVRNMSDAERARLADIYSPG